MKKSWFLIALALFIVFCLVFNAMVPSLVFSVKIDNQTESDITVYLVDAQKNKLTVKDIGANADGRFGLCSGGSVDQVAGNMYLVTALNSSGETLHNEVLKLDGDKVRYEIAIQETMGNDLSGYELQESYQFQECDVKVYNKIEGFGSILQIFKQSTLVYQLLQDERFILEHKSEDGSLLKVGDDITGNDLPNVVVGVWSGNAHGDMDYLILEIGEFVNVIATIDALAGVSLAECLKAM